MADWRIQKREDLCARCDRAFADDEVFYSVLRADEAGLSREDRCQACFEASRTPGAEGAGAPGDLFFWRTRRQPAREPRFRVDFDAIEGLFLALEGREEERLRELRYLLTLLLMRKKRLKLVRVLRTDGAESMVLRRPRRDEAWNVAVFDLPAERMAALRQDLARIFEGAGAEELLEAAPVEEGEEEMEGEDGGEGAASQSTLHDSPT